MEATTGTEQPSSITLHVSNQSFADDPVGITVGIDGVVVVDDDFAAAGQHSVSTFELATSPGDHQLVVTSSTGVTESASLRIPAAGHGWVAVIYWFSAPPAPRVGRPRRFTVTVADEPIALA